MAKESGNTRTKNGGFKEGDSNFNGKITGVQSLKAIKNKKIYSEVGGAIGRFHSVLGVRQREIKLANLPITTLGVHVTENGQSAGIFLNRKVFNSKDSTTQSIVNIVKGGYESGFTTKTNKPIAHVVTHELAHATWNEHLTTEKAKQASGEIYGLFKQFKKDKSKKDYGRYAHSDVGEFFAEVCTKAVHGNSDKYTTRIKQIIKKYNL